MTDNERHKEVRTLRTLTNFIFITDEPHVVELRDGDKVFGQVEEITSRSIGAERVNVAKVTLWGPDILHKHEKREETYICLEGEGELYLNGRIFDFVSGKRAIIGSGVWHAARPKEACKELILLCVSSPAFDPDDVYEDSRGRKWRIKRKEEKMVEVNQKVVIVPTDIADEEFGREVEKKGKIVLTVLSKSNLGVCTLLLPKGVSIQGHSHPLPPGPYEGHDYIDLHESHLAPA